MDTVLLKDEKRTIGEVSIDAKAVYEALKKIEIGDSISYDEISRLIGRDILKNRNILVTARNLARRNDNMVFDCIHKEGLRRLSDSQIVDKSASQPFRRIRSTLRNAAKDMNCVKTENVSNEEVVRLNSVRSIFNAVFEFSKPKSVEMLKSEVNEKPLAFGKTLDFFKNN